MAELLEFDPTDQDAANSPLSVMNTNYRVTAHSYPAPQPSYVWASSVDTEGSALASMKHENRSISMSIEMVDATGALTRALQAKVAKIGREGGYLKRTLATGQIIYFDLLTSEQFDPTFDVSYYAGNLVTVDLQFGARPYGRGAPVTLSSHTETALPCLVFTETGITGDVPALGKLIISDAQAVDQWFVMWGQQSRYYSSATSAAFYYEAEGRTPMTSAAIAAGPTGASGAGSNVVRHTELLLSHQAVVSTQAVSAGSHLSHIGDFKVWARVQVPTTNAGSVTAAFEWAQGDLSRWTRNAEYTIDTTRNGTWVLVPLGQVSLAKAAQGTQRWEGRILAKSTASGDDIDIDCIFIVPVSEGYGEARGLVSAAAPSSFLARDEFNQTTGALTGKTLPVGGTWSGLAIGASGTVDFSIDATNHYLNRVDTSGSTRSRVAHNTTNYASVAVQADIQSSSVSLGTYAGGLAARVVDANNYMYVVVASGILNVAAQVGGVGLFVLFQNITGFAPGDWVTTRLVVDAAGRWKVYAGRQGTTLTLRMSGQHAQLATGGALATGKAGPFDANTTSTTRVWDNLQIWNPASDAAMFASQSLEVRHDQILRESSDGTSWAGASNYEGSYLRIPPAGAEARTLRLFVKASRGDPDNLGADSAIDDITAQLVYVPRFLVIP